MDILWGLGFAMIALLNLGLTAYCPIWKMAMSSLIVLWAVRLSLHITIKNKGKAEDFRYQNWRKNWGKTEWWRSYLQIYLLQGFFMFTIALPIISMLSKPYNPDSFPVDGIFLFPTLLAFVGLLIESIADLQKSKFKTLDPKGLMKEGLWKYSRHPNYFGEAVFWWGIACFTLENHPLLGLISALTITILLRFVSGVPMLEKAKEGNEAYDQYKKETPVFVPFLKP
jgi:steroid 5-alpha reductase family enzyme